jgi:hypothetical protein
MKIKYNLEIINVNDILSIIPFANKNILLETNNKNYLFKKSDNNFEITEFQRKGKTYILSLEEKNYLFYLNDNEELMIENI